MKNKNHPNLSRFVELFNIKQIETNDLKPIYEGAANAEEFREKLIEISPYLKSWLKIIPSNSSIDKILQQETHFIECDCLKLYYNNKFIQETNVYFDSIPQMFYITRPWDSETTFINLPKKLCQLLKIEGFENNLRFLLKGTKEEIIKKFKTLSIGIPVPENEIRLPSMSSSDIQPINSLSDESMSSEQTSDEEEYRSYTHECSNYQRCHAVSTKRKRHRSITLVDEIFSHLNLIDLSTISNSSSASIKTSFNRNQSGGNGEIDMQTGLTGEGIVYEYLVNQYCDQSNSISIHWLNQNGECSLPYDIILTENGIQYYIEVKATRSNNQHTFFLSMNQMKAILQYGNNYQIYRVYLKQKKLVILNDIESSLKDRNQLALLLTMNPKSLDQTIFTDE